MSFRGVDRRSYTRRRSDNFGRRRTDAIHPWRWRLLTLWIIIFTLVTIVALRAANDASKHAEESVTIIQESRLEFCQRTYFVMQSIITEAFSDRQLDAFDRARLNRMLELADPEACLAQTGSE